MDDISTSTASWLNISDDNSTVPFQISTSRSIMMSCLMFGAGVVGNALALILMATSPAEQRRTVFYKLMFGLALTDLVGTCATSPVVIHIYATGATLASHQPQCHYFSFMLVFAAFATMSLVCGMAVERYICLCHPYIYQCKLPTSFARYVLLASWAVSLVIAALPLLGLGQTVAQFPNTWCFFDATSRRPQDRVFSFLFASITLLALGVTLWCNIAATYTVLALRRRQKALTACRAPGVTRGRSLAQRFAELHMLVILVGVTIIFTSCFAPLMVFTLICQTEALSRVDVQRTYLLMIRLASFNPILDPWVYILVRRELRWRIVCLFKCLLRIKHPPGFGGGMAGLPRYNEPPLFPPDPKVNGGGGRGGSTPRYSIDSELGEPVLVETPSVSPVTPVTPASSSSTDSDMSFWTFCFHCLCDPPVQRSSNALARSRASWASRTSVALSPTRVMRNASTESILGNPRDKIVLNGPPLATDQLLLSKLTTEPPTNNL